MGSMSRSIRRKKQLAEKKAAKKRLKKLQHAIDKMPDHCGSCGKTAEPDEDTSQLDWHVEIDQDSNVKLTCPKCKGGE
tara:strand:+ start:635 stop:868 length:234 start_codon:yes stop_codon:yes gene_type:complete